MMLHQEGSGLPYHSMIYIATIMMMKWTPPHGGGVNLIVDVLASNAM